MKAVQHSLVLALVGSLGVILSGCTGCGSSPDSTADELRVGIMDEPQTLDPRYAADAYGQRIGQLLFSRLVGLGYDLTIVPDIAESWEIPDAKTYVFHLRDDVQFHDGEPLTAEDVAFTFEHLMDAGTKSYFGTAFRTKIAGIEVIDSLTVRFDLHQPTASFLTDLIFPILPKHVLSQQIDSAELLVGSGPYRFVARSPSKIVLEAHDQYHLGTPQTKRVVVEVIQDESTRLFKLRKGELDILINAISPQKLGMLVEPPLDTLYQVVEEPGVSYDYMAFNFASPAVESVELRRAIAHAINVDELLTHQLSGHAVRASGLLSPVNWYCEPDVTTYDHDPQEAMRLLDSAGFTDPDGDGPQPRLTLELKISNSPEAVDKASRIQDQLKQVGIRLELRTYEWQTFFQDIKTGNFQLTIMRWVGVTEPDFYYSLYHSSKLPPEGRNRGRYSNPGIDQLVEAGRATMDPEQRRQIYSQVQKQVAVELPYISLWHINNVSIVHRRAHGYRQHPTGAWYSFYQIKLEEGA
jgi:peptide/nickel transport system substrate-binding protein